MKGLFIAVSGPSGVGKGTVLNLVKKAFPKAVYLVSETTRKMRPHEKPGQVYDFVSREHFEKGIAEDKYLEYAIVHEQEYYGTLKQPVLDALKDGKLMIREIDRQGMHQIKKLLPSENFLSIFIYPPSLEILLDRISHRGTLPDEEMKRRMESARVEIADEDSYDYRVINEQGKLQECFEKIVEIIKKECEKRGIEV